MELWEAMRQRRSIRRFEPRPVPKEILEEIIGKALWAPSRMNTQEWYLVVMTREKMQEILPLIRQSGERLRYKLEERFPERPDIIEGTLRFFADLGGAPVAVFAFIPRSETHLAPGMDSYSRYKVESSRLDNIQSTAALLQNLLLLAHEAGLGSTWMTGPLTIGDEICGLLGLEGMELVAVIPLGYPAQQPKAPPRRIGRVEWRGF
ncbi:MAG: nitroreductase family protein [Firmicutes bacterium]|nr:nitroreductase family protein [Bacillota bacterium]